MRLQQSTSSGVAGSTATTSSDGGGLCSRKVVTDGAPGLEAAVTLEPFRSTPCSQLRRNEIEEHVVERASKAQRSAKNEIEFLDHAESPQS